MQKSLKILIFGRLSSPSPFQGEGRVRLFPKFLFSVIFIIFGGLAFVSTARAVYPVAGRRKLLLAGLLLPLFILFGGLAFAAPAYGATEFVSIVDPDNGAGTSWTSLSAWEQNTQTDLSTSTTKVFSLSSASGTFAVGSLLSAILRALPPRQLIVPLRKF